MCCQQKFRRPEGLEYLVLADDIKKKAIIVHNAITTLNLYIHNLYDSIITLERERTTIKNIARQNLKIRQNNLKASKHALTGEQTALENERATLLKKKELYPPIELWLSSMKGALESEQIVLSEKFDNLALEEEALRGTYEALGMERNRLLDEWMLAKDQLQRYTQERRELSSEHQDVMKKYRELMDKENEAR
ncbi:hypothetical protein PHISCL_00388 [Aspergillus sclerotialis]|uniref:Uncharacterized protein n=1 Tax=Aspergillus sclerotialis TaxID=2070753 RepID=A0A3A3A0V1_9EURO|nr:hypothetical protein PHISCL_00388 [Aspergillus sclerotialis]